MFLAFNFRSVLSTFFRAKSYESVLCWLDGIFYHTIGKRLKPRPMQTRMRVDESSNSRSRLAWNSHALSSTLMRSRQLWTCSNFSWESMRVWRTLVLVWPELMIVDESWRKLSWELTLILVWPGLKSCLNRWKKIALCQPSVEKSCTHPLPQGHACFINDMT